MPDARPDAPAVLDASALVELLLDTRAGRLTADRIDRARLHVPAHCDAEVLSALGRLHRAGEVTTRVVGESLEQLEVAPIERHALAPLVRGAWAKRGSLRLVDALYVELAARLDAPIITTDAGLASATTRAELVRPL